MQRRRAPQRGTNGQPRDLGHEALESTIQKLLADPGSDIASLVKPLIPDRAKHERRLLERLPQASAEEQLATVRLLEHLGSPRCVPALLRLSRVSQTHAAAVRALAPHAEPALLAELVERETDRALQRELLLELMARREPQAVAIYLALIAEPATRQPALAALDQVSQPPVEILFGYLNGADAPHRLAAALVLGRLDGPEITQRLIRQALSNVYRHEALLALLANRSEEARRFVTLAERDQSLFAAVHSARMQLQFLPSPQRGAQL